ncbi:MAG: ABC transporter permease [Actinobacteria bacterium]|nr:ABC transporter permease [Actinomycetota bacterium]MBV8959350.1 ABC transporter permease [Actinomycetota bacterium]MBV9255684.1 ABC transporter permease [Actinomycetota bacterium]MBV9662794.1 ABC transporter permease [Actinomycetota bacterium]
MSRRWDSYRLLLRWQYLRFRPFLPMLVIIQVLLAVGVVYGLAFLLPHIDRSTALYLATGAPTLTLLILGLNVVPQEVSQGRVTGKVDFLKAQPVPRLAPLASEVTFWLLVQLPGTALALLVAVLRFHIGLHVGLSVIPAVALVALSGAAVGYAMAATLPPNVTNQVTSFLSLLILLFSPINFPASRLPIGARVVHRVLPVQYMADVIRGSLTGKWADSAALAFAVVGVWCAAGLALSYRAAIRRQ